MSNLSILKAEKVVFERISFERIGFKNEASEPEIECTVQIGEDAENFIYKVSVGICVKKDEEYEANVVISGFFSFSSDENASEKDILLRQNAVAILFPYLRSELTLLTAQPDTDSIVLPIMNISEMMKKD